MALAVVAGSLAKVATGTASSPSANWTTTAASLLVCCVAAFRSGGPSITSVSDPVNGAWTLAGTGAAPDADDIVAIYYKENAGALTAQPVTVALAAAADVSFTVSEITGAATASSADGYNTATGTSTTPSVGITTTQAATILIGVFAHTGTNRTLTPGSGFTMLNENEGGSANMPVHSEYKIVAASGAQTINGTIGTGSVLWGIVGAGFKEAGGGAETITVDKWFAKPADVMRRKIGVVPSGTIGIKT